MEYRLAQMSDLPELCSFYQEVCDHQKFDQYNPSWQWGVHPSEQMLRDAISDDDKMMLIAVDWTKIAAAGILYTGDDPMYAQGHWLHKVSPAAIRTLHLFATRPQYRGHGLSKEFLLYICREAKQAGAEAIHLDIVAVNPPAQRTYERAGFQVSEELILNYSDIGPTVAKLMERDLRNI